VNDVNINIFKHSVQ